MNWRKLTKKLGISLLSLAIVLIAAELFARATEPGPFSLWDRRPYATHDELPHVHKPDFQGRWDGTWYGINSKGMRGPEFEPQFTENEYRVLAIGDSCTFGKGVLERETWPRQLERRLAAQLGPDFQPMVANLGINGFSGKHYLHLIGEVCPQLRPDLIVVGYNINDFPNVVQKVDFIVFQGKQSLRAKVPYKIRDQLGRLALFRWLRGQYYAMNREKHWKQSEELVAEVRDASQVDSRNRFEKEVDRIGQMAAAAEACGSELVIFLFPFESPVYMQDFDRSAIEWLEEACALHGVTFIDMLEPFRQTAREEEPMRALFLRGDRYHPRPEGYAIVAEQLMRVLVEKAGLPGTQ